MPPINPSRIEVPDDAVVAVLRRLTPAERLAIANRMWVSTRTALLTMLRADHPQWTDEQVQHEAARRMCGAI
jgi:hypothetical protein